MAVYKAKNGKWYCQFMIKGERIHKLLDGAKDQTQAKELEDAERFKLRQIQNGLIKREEKKIPIQKGVTLFLNYSKIHKKDFHNDEIKSKVVLSFFKGKNLSEILLKDIEAFVVYLTKERKLKKATVNRYISFISSTFDICIKNKLCSLNPCKELKKFKEDNQKIRYLTTEEEKRLFEFLPERIKPIIITALHTGLRRGNILNLKWSDIDFDYNFIEILKQDNKGHKSIKIPLSDKLLEVLNSIPKTSEYVFINPQTGEPYNEITKSFNNACKKANIENFRFHDLRHTVATRLVERGVDIRTVQEIMAHSSIVTTQRYMHPTPQRKLEAINVLNSYN